MPQNPADQEGVPGRGELLFALSLGVLTLVFGIVNLIQGDLGTGLILIAIGLASTTAILRFLSRSIRRA